MRNRRALLHRAGDSVGEEVCTFLRREELLALLGKTGVVDDPRFEGSVLLNSRQYHFSHFRQ